ncbi:MAG: 30S ribosomal protein S6 [Leptospiraceae bacterium]|nr:30S ribosomal protein S6 [Leptospiraceae bacterium]MCP5497986.1 30S ribosomal protein S6 [Leptospiraceae bacterium]
MREYEITAVLKEGAQPLIDETKNTIKSVLAKYSGEITAEEDWGQKRIWHPINGENAGFFTHIKCKLEASSIKEIEKDFRLNQNILRSMIARA